MELQGLLRHLGQRLRRAREERGLSLAETAREAGISRRYLTEAEAGRANPSFLVLARLASALGTRLAELCAVPLAQARGRIALVGLRGAGKSSIGRQLARELEAPFVELDRRVEELAGLSLGELFELHGPTVFHRLEGEALEAVLSEGERTVIATGGSIVESLENFQRLFETCRTVWLRASPEEHFDRVVAQGDRRPMDGHPRAMEELKALLARREPLYSRCELTVDTSDRSPDEVQRTLVERLQEASGTAP